MKEKEELEKIADGECFCENKSPWTKCSACTAAHALNEAAQIIREGYDEIMEKMKKENAES